MITMSRSYKSVPILDLTPSRNQKKYLKKKHNKLIRKELKRTVFLEEEIQEHSFHKKLTDTWWDDLLDKGYVTKEYYDTFGGRDKLIRK